MILEIDLYFKKLKLNFIFLKKLNPLRHKFSLSVSGLASLYMEVCVLINFLIKHANSNAFI